MFDRNIAFARRERMYTPVRASCRRRREIVIRESPRRAVTSGFCFCGQRGGVPQFVRVHACEVLCGAYISMRFSVLLNKHTAREVKRDEI